MKLTLGISLLLCASLSGKVLQDKRDGNTYPLSLQNGKLWFAADLRFAHEGAFNETHPKRSNKDCNYYSFSALNGLCPEGTHLATLNEWESLFWSKYDSSEVVITEYNGMLGRAYQTKLKDKTQNMYEELEGLNLQSHGWVEGNKIQNKKTHHLWIDNTTTHDPKHHIHMGPSGYVSHAHEHNLSAGKANTLRRFAVRCVCDSIAKR